MDREQLLKARLTWKGGKAGIVSENTSIEETAPLAELVGVNR